MTNIGIGMSSPSKKLDIHGTGTVNIGIGLSPDKKFHLCGPECYHQKWYFRPFLKLWIKYLKRFSKQGYTYVIDDGDVLVVESSGNVGIGT